MNSIVRQIERAPDVAADSFRAAMRQLAGGVSVVTAGRDEDISGTTVTSVVSLSAEPPRLLVNLNRQTSSLALIRRYGFFGVNILASHQQSVAARFSDHSIKGADRFAGAEWSARASGVPLLSDALASIDCEVEEIIERHSHAILIGRLVDVRVMPGTAGLIYWDGSYRATDGQNPVTDLATPGPSPRTLWQI